MNNAYFSLNDYCYHTCFLAVSLTVLPVDEVKAILSVTVTFLVLVVIRLYFGWLAVDRVAGYC